MDKKRKQLIFLLGSVFVAVIFLTSYAAFSNNNGSSSSTSTVKPSTTFFALGNSNALIINYSDIAVVIPKNSNSSKNNVTAILSGLETNGSVQNYIYSNGSYQVVLATISAYGLQQLLYRKTGQPNSITVGSTATVFMPSNVVLYYTNVPVVVAPPSRNYSVYVKSVKSPGTIINVSISALLNRNGSIYNSQFRVSYNG
jgi:hypothetical protein